MDKTPDNNPPANSPSDKPDSPATTAGGQSAQGSAQGAGQAEAIPAATLVVFRHGNNASLSSPAQDASGEAKPAPEILMVTRSRKMAFAGGAAVFPGGRLDPADYQLASRIHQGIGEDEAAHRIAAIRETLEETGLVTGMAARVQASQAMAARELLLEKGDLASVLDQFGWELDLGSLLPFARWHPINERLPRVFDTRFYLTDLGTGSVDIAVDQSENTKLFWISAQGALDAADNGDIQIIFPTRRNLERLAQFADFAQAADDCDKYPVRKVVPFLTEEEGRKWLHIRDDLGYPVTSELLDSALRGER